MKWVGTCTSFNVSVRNVWQLVKTNQQTSSIVLLSNTMLDVCWLVFTNCHTFLTETLKDVHVPTHFITPHYVIQNFIISSANKNHTINNQYFAKQIIDFHHNFFSSFRHYNNLYTQILITRGPLRDYFCKELDISVKQIKITVGCCGSWRQQGYCGRVNFVLAKFFLVTRFRATGCQSCVFYINCE